MTDKVINPLILTTYLDGDYREYSGRCMYGQYCPGFIYDTQEDAMLDLVGCIFEVCQSGHFTDQDLEDLKADISSFKIDSLGRSVILYFPNIALEGN